MKSLGDLGQKDLSPKEMVDFFKNEAIDFAPSERFEYNNSGYVILGFIIEIFSGKNFEEYINENIFDKVGMNYSRYGSDKSIVKKRAYGYQKNGHGYVNEARISFAIPFSSESLMSTVSDMLKWKTALT